MIYFYERGGRFTRCEVHALGDTSYELVVDDADGSHQVEEFACYDDLVKRLEGLQYDLARRGRGGPHGRDL